MKSYGVSVFVLCPGPTRGVFSGLAEEDSAPPQHDKRVISAEEVEFITLKALDKNRAIISPGWCNRLQAMAPRWLVHNVAARCNRMLSHS